MAQTADWTLLKKRSKELEAQKVKRLKKWTDPRDMSDNIKWSSIGVTGVLEGKETEIESQKLFEDPMTNFSPLFDEKHYLIEPRNAINLKKKK